MNKEVIQGQKIQRWFSYSAVYETLILDQENQFWQLLSPNTLSKEMYFLFCHFDREIIFCYSQSPTLLTWMA